ncbi:hypothetical protein C9374_012196 [Naegleria lovaniensis]|uniref:Uncharacterized protein n=1 Tax=Naegleria lovaniensis TaxID=51637 RepID=A0AA88GDB2_NAELO|nr:uncharacterized protein C9374_012196 [Naegleria lovaniensis]KAG2373330.1 hypothetical protein C9374_012196 [Naegleria lovaniensis]
MTPSMNNSNTSSSLHQDSDKAKAPKLSKIQKANDKHNKFGNHYSFKTITTFQMFLSTIQVQSSSSEADGEEAQEDSFESSVEYNFASEEEEETNDHNDLKDDITAVESFDIFPLSTQEDCDTVLGEAFDAVYYP